MPAGCSHYENKCEIWTPCCDRYYRCFRCHDESSSSCGKPIDRSKVARIRCLDCAMEQEPAKECKGCHVSFAEYICLECSMYRQSHPDGIYHCPHCKVCRVGKGLDISHWHCHSCCLCLSIETVDKEEHEKVCKIDVRSVECVVCFESLHDSQDPLVVGHSCGHYLHKSCWEAYNNTMGKIACPICQQPFVKIDGWKLKDVFVPDILYWAVLCVTMVNMTENKRQDGIATAASVSFVVVGLQRYGFALGLSVAPILMSILLTKHAPQMGIENTALLCVIAMNKIFRRVPILNLPGMQWVGLCLEIIACSMILHYFVYGQYDLPRAEADPENTHKHRPSFY